MSSEIPETNSRKIEEIPPLLPPVESVPIKDDQNSYYFDHEPEPIENVTLHYLKRILGGEQLHKFVLIRNIAGLNYILSLSRQPNVYGKGSYSLNFKTREYEYATTDLDPDSLVELFTQINTFIESAREYTKDDILRIVISPADAGFSARDIEQCIEQILDSPQNTLSKEELMSEDYKGFRIFHLYETIYGKNFKKEGNSNNDSRAYGRSRLFKAAIKKYFPNWEIDTEYSWPGADFAIKPKQSLL